MSEVLQQPGGGSDQGLAGALTVREREVLHWLTRGFSNRQIAEQLTVSVRTVETHVERILRKLQLPSRSQVAVWALANLST